MFHEWSNILASIPQRWEHRKYVQAIVQVTSKFTALDLAFEVLVSCGYQAHIDTMSAPASEAFEFLLLQNTEELRLPAALLNRKREVWTLDPGLVLSG